MIRTFLANKIKPVEIAVKLFGGATIIGGSGNGGRQLSIGAMNIAAARRILEENKLSLAAVHVGGDLGRKLVFNSQTGSVLTKSVQKILVAGLAV